MKRAVITNLAVLMVIALSMPAAAVPRLQTYIVDSQYSIYSRPADFFTWRTSSQSFDLKVVGYWDRALDAVDTKGLYTGRSIEMSSYGRSYDYMDCYLAMSVPRDQSGAIYVNGVEISSFYRWFDAVPAGTRPSPMLPLTGPSYGNRYSFLDIGRIDNDQIGAMHYGFGRIGTPGWGDEITMNVVVRGFDWAHFDAIGVDAAGMTHTNWQTHDSGYYATPEPSTLSLLGLGLLGIAPLLRRKKR